MAKDEALSDLGERAIVRDILPKFVSNVGDDCAVYNIDNVIMAITTDPVPVPAAKLIGGDPDLYWMGRLLVTINASDLAAAGASPACFVAAIDSPSNLPTVNLERLLEGVRDACNFEGLSYVGGNLRESSSLSAVGTAVGVIRGSVIRRLGASEGDILMSVGAGGIFWRDALIILKGQPVREKRDSPVFCPRSQLRVMSELGARNLIKAAIDNSDGLLPSVELLSAASQIGIELYLDQLLPPLHLESLDVDPVRLWLGWGDWNVITAVAPEKVNEVRDVAKENGSIALPIGACSQKEYGVVLSRAGHSMRAPRLESERFVIDSWFNVGIERYIDQLLGVELP